VGSEAGNQQQEQQQQRGARKNEYAKEREKEVQDVEHYDVLTNNQCEEIWQKDKPPNLVPSHSNIETIFWCFTTLIAQPGIEPGVVVQLR